ncbi:MAG: endolytic transglycosylase MltG [Janthinobacterium lividum]
MKLLASLALLLLLSAGAATALALRAYDAPGPLPEPRDVAVPHATTEALAQALAAQGVVASAPALRLAAVLTARQGPLHAAELAFPAHASLRDVLAVLRTARPVEHRLTIPEGLTAAQIAGLLAAEDALDGPDPIPAEGAALPQTYSFERGTLRDAVLARAQAAMTRALDDAWSSRAPGLPLADPRQALTLASIVERETARPEERPLVAAVFLNRLKRGMKLQADPTVAYGASGGLGALDHRLSRADLDHDDPYNTYRNAGLPPGPICSPGAAALAAATHPADSNALYFVADGHGGHAFARTLEEHDRNVARWRAGLDAPG